MADYGGPTATSQLPLHRKPVPPPKLANPRLKPLTPIYTDGPRPTATAAGPVPAGYPPQMAQSHSRTRTSSSSIFPSTTPSFVTAPSAPQQQMSQQQMSQQQMSQQQMSQQQMSHPAYQYHQQFNSSTRRTPSNATQSTSTTGTSGGRTPARNVSNASTNNNLRRSSSSRSGGYSPSSYVALMRKQKATVWCDRSQPEDPRIAAQQKVAKMRAAMEVVGGAGPGGRAQTLGSSSLTGSSLMSKSKIRHHGRQAVVEMSPKALVGGVNSMPVRLSASEVGDDANGGEADGYSGSHRRNMSGTSSMAAAAQQRWLLQQQQQQQQQNQGRSNTFTTRQSRLSSTNQSSPDSINENGSSPYDPGETPVPGDPHRGGGGGGDYFQVGQPSAPGANSSGSSSAEGRENSFGGVGQMAPASSAGPGAAQGSSTGLGREKSIKSPEELRRRGSVDDRAMTMTGVRLFVANPDLSD